MLGDGSISEWNQFNLQADFEIEEYFKSYIESFGLLFKKITKQGTDAVH